MTYFKQRSRLKKKRNYSSLISYCFLSIFNIPIYMILLMPNQILSLLCSKIPNGYLNSPKSLQGPTRSYMIPLSFWPHLQPSLEFIPHRAPHQPPDFSLNLQPYFQLRALAFLLSDDALPLDPSFAVWSFTSFTYLSECHFCRPSLIL